MQIRRSTLDSPLWLGALVALALAAGGCEPKRADHGTGTGTVVAVDAAKSEITLDHGEIPDMMGAMTMTFVVSNPALLEGLAPGQRVEFDLQYAAGTYTVTGIRAP